MKARNAQWITLFAASLSLLQVLASHQRCKVPVRTALPTFVYTALPRHVFKYCVTKVVVTHRHTYTRIHIHTQAHLHI